MIKKIILMCGLPGSGKSTWAEGKAKEDYTNAIISFDRCRYEEDVDNVLHDFEKRYYYKAVIIDGLFLTNESRVKIINKVKYILRLIDPEVEIYEWKENRKACLENDKGRREVDSRITIDNAPFEPVDLGIIEKGLNFHPKAIDVYYMNVKIYTLSDRILYYGDDEGKLKSDSWCGGGTSGSCWSSDLATIAGEPPVEFTQLDDLLEKIVPNITFLKYKKILAECVETEEYDLHDYYGGTTTNYRYVCDLKKLVDFIENM